MASVHDCTLHRIRHVHDERGSLVVIEAGRDVPFEIKRVYYIFDVPTHSSRAGHAHRALCQLYIAISGSFDVVLDDGRERRRVTLNHPDEGLLLGPGIWREIVNFSGGAVVLVLASAYYAEADYIRSHDAFLTAVAAGAFP